MNKEAILKKLNKDIPLFLYDTVPSTNTLAREETEKGAENFSTFLATHQTQGRGRYGKSFFSPDTGLYLSTVIRPRYGAADGWKVTVAAAVAAVRAIKTVFSESAGIKWVNDIYLRGRKVSGILCEAMGNDMEYAIVGIGFNVETPKCEVPGDIPLFGTITDRCENDKYDSLAAEFLREFFSLYDTDCLDEYRKYCFILGGTVYVNGAPHTALSVNEKGGLTVKNDLTGEISTLSSGEISIKLQ